MFINGKFTSGETNKSIEIINPATEEILDKVPCASALEANKAVHAAQNAYQDWRRTPASERADMLHEIARKIRDHHDEIVRLLTMCGFLL